MKLVFPLYINKSLSTYQNKFVGFFFVCVCHTTQLVGSQFPDQGEPRPLAVKAQNPNHWTAREFLSCRNFNSAYHVFQYPIFQILSVFEQEQPPSKEPRGGDPAEHRGRHSTSTMAPPLGAVLSVRDGSPFLPSWYLSHRKCYKGFFKKGNSGGLKVLTLKDGYLSSAWCL